MNEQSLARIEHEGSMQEYSVQDVVAQVAKVQLIMQNVMKEGDHYGKIPGCGDKPSLLKPGAEKLGFTFRLAPKFYGETDPRDLGRGHREYIIRCELFHIQSGTFVGSGVGSCSTMEAKYRYRTGPKEGTGKPVPKEYWDMRQSNPAKAQELIGGKGFAVAKSDGKWEIVRQGEKVEHDNPADHYNTVLKMAKKRAHVDAILTATAASDIFTQDIEDLDSADKQAAKESPAASTQHVSPPQVQDEEAPTSDYDDAPAPPAPQTPDSPVISDPQRRRMYALARKSGMNDSQFKSEIERMGYKSSSDVTRENYEDVCSFFENWKP